MSGDDGAAAGPLAGLRVLDLTSVIMGPFATQIFGDLGAEVICVEAAGGDAVRTLGAARHPQLCGTALNVLRNKRNIALNLKNPAGLAALMRIVTTCDVLVTNLRPDRRARLGIAYQDIITVRPDIIYCHAQGWSQASGRAEAPAYDDVIQAAGGMADLLVRQNGHPAVSPLCVGDQVASLTMVYSILAALHHRDRTGAGQCIEVPMVDTLAAFVLVMHGHDAVLQPPLGAPGYQRVISASRRPNPTKDGNLQIVLYTRKNWVELFTSAGRTDAADDPRLVTPQSRNEHYAELYGEMADALLLKTNAEWIDWCAAHGIACAPVTSLDALLDEMPTAEHPSAGAYRQIPIPVKFSGTPCAIRRPAPLIDEHCDEILAEAGYTTDEVAELKNAGALQENDTSSAIR